MVPSSASTSHSDSDVPGRSPPPVLIENLGVSYGGTPALRQISLRIHAGEKVVVLGPVGSGKTSLLQTIAGLVRPDRRGRVETVGSDPWKTTGVVGHSVSYLPQRLRLWENLTIGQTFELARGLTPNWSSDREAELRARFSLDDSREVSSLSALERRLLSMSLCFSAKTKLWLLDSPTGKLESRARHDILEPLCALLKEAWSDSRNPVTTLITTNHPDDAKILGERLVIIDRGRIRLDHSLVSLEANAREVRFPASSNDPPKLTNAVAERRADDMIEVVTCGLSEEDTSSLNLAFGDAWTQRPIDLDTLFVRTTGTAARARPTKP